MSRAKEHTALRNRDPLEPLSRSRIFRDYQRAFSAGTGLPLALQTAGSPQVVKYPKGQVNPFCALLVGTSPVCSACYSLQQEVALKAHLGTQTLRCFAGLCESAVPVRVTEGLIAFLHTGQVLLHKPSRRQFNRIARELLRWGSAVDLKSAEELYFQTRVLRPRQYTALLRLLEIFAHHLAVGYEQLMLKARPAEPPAVTKAREFIDIHHPEPLSLPQVAKTVSVSATHFSRRFKQATGMTFVDYLGRVRVEKAKNLLQNPALRITEIAYEVGFRSLSQFNRTFRRVTRISPTELRLRQ